MSHWNHDDSNSTHWAEKGMASMWNEARRTGLRQQAVVTGVFMSCYPCASGAILWRANGHNYSRRDLTRLLARRRRFGHE